jgi:hypothetical protein
MCHQIIIGKEESDMSVVQSVKSSQVGAFEIVMRTLQVELATSKAETVLLADLGQTFFLFVSDKIEHTITNG